MIEGINDLIHENANNVNKLNNVIILVEDFSDIPMPSSLHYKKFIQELKEILEIEDDN